MGDTVRDGRAMVAGMSPVLGGERYVFVTGRDDLLAAAVAFFREEEGMSLIVPVAAGAEGLVMRCITLNVHSALDGIGLTAAVATALAEKRIACNMVAAYHHDHVFVPEPQAEAALAALLALQASV